MWLLGQQGAKAQAKAKAPNTEPSGAAAARWGPPNRKPTPCRHDPDILTETGTSLSFHFTFRPGQNCSDLEGRDEQVSWYSSLLKVTEQKEHTKPKQFHVFQVHIVCFVIYLQYFTFRGHIWTLLYFWIILSFEVKKTVSVKCQLCYIVAVKVLLSLCE